MPERIDHEARAYEALSHVPMNGTVEQALAVAQIAATLALVEQQRIGNLIALGKAYEQYQVPADDETREDSYWATRLRNDVREALRL